jgi:hypothetical protein
MVVTSAASLFGEGERKGKEKKTKSYSLFGGVLRRESAYDTVGVGALIWPDMSKVE